MTTFVIVHGAFGGGWEWTPVARELRSRGYDAFTPTLTGMGDRSHLGPQASLSTHVQDLLSVFEFEDLHDVVLCAASYGGMAATWAADKIPQRVSLLVYIDALIPRQGESGLDLLPSNFGDTVRQSPDGWAPFPDGILPPEAGISPEVRESYIARLRPQPVATFTEAVSLSGGIDSVRRAFVRCTRASFPGMNDPISPMAERARVQGWPYREVDLPHDPHLFDPVSTARVLEDLSRTVD